MKSTVGIALALLMAQTEAQTGSTIFVESNNECWFNEGATFVKPCFSLFYWYCDKYEIEPDSACAVRTFTDTEIDNPWEQVDVHYQSFGYDGKWLEGLDQFDDGSSGSSSSFDSFFRKLNVWGADEMTQFLNLPNPRPTTHQWYPEWEDPFSQGCYELTSYAVVYDSATSPKLDVIPGICGFKIQFDNYATKEALDVMVLRDGASTIVSSAALAVLAAAAILN